MCLSAVLGLGSAVVGAASSSKASKAQQAAASADLALQQQIYEETTDRFSPYLESGTLGHQAYLYELGLGEAPTIGGKPLEVVEFSETTESPNLQYNAISPWWGGGQGDDSRAHTPTITDTQTRYRVGDQIFDTREAADEFAVANPTGGSTYQGMQTSPAYQFLLDQGVEDIQSAAAARGGLYSGATGTALERYRMGLASQEQNTLLNRLAGISSQGQAAAGSQAGAGQAYAQGAGQAYGNIGQARAAGAIGVGNAITGGIDQGLGLYGYLQGQGTA